MNSITWWHSAKYWLSRGQEEINLLNHKRAQPWRLHNRNDTTDSAGPQDNNDEDLSFGELSLELDTLYVIPKSFIHMYNTVKLYLNSK